MSLTLLSAGALALSMLPAVRADLHCSAEINGENVCDWINDYTGVGIAILLGILGIILFFIFLFGHMRNDHSSRWSLPTTAPSQDYLRAISPAPQLPPIASRSASPFPFPGLGANPGAGAPGSPKTDSFNGETLRPRSYHYVNTYVPFGQSSTSSLVRPPPAYDSPQMRSSVQAGQYHGFAI